MKLTAITSIDEFSALECEYDTLLAQCSGKLLYVSFDYLVSWLTTIGAERPFTILVLRDREKLLGVCPLISQSTAEQRLWGVRTTTFPGAGLWGYADFVCSEDKKASVLPMFLNELLSGGCGDFVELGPFVANSSSARIVQQFLAAKGVSFTSQPQDGAIFIDTAMGFEEYEKALAGRKSVTSDIARCARRLDELGHVSVMRVPDRVSRDEFARYLGEFFALYMKQWPENRFNKNPMFKDLYLEFGYRASQKGFLDFSFLLLNERPIACHFGFVHNNSLYYFTPTFDVEYRRYSPGKILLRRLIERCFEEHLEFDFLNAIDSYKLEWSSTIRERVMFQQGVTFKWKLYMKYSQCARRMRGYVSKAWRIGRQLMGQVARSHVEP